MTSLLGLVNLESEAAINNAISALNTDTLTSSNTSNTLVTTTSNIKDIMSLGTILTYIRRVIYQILGFCCNQYVFYFFPEHELIIANISENLQYMENTHLAVLLNQFVVKYIMNAPPTQYMLQILS